MLLSYLWTALVAVSVAAAKYTGYTGLSAAAADGAAEGVRVTLAIAGVICLWSGLARVMQASGVTRAAARLLRPLLRRLFPQAAEEPDTLAAIGGNFTANLLGLGSAATPLGVEAVQRMRRSAPDDRATDEMCRLIVLNTASIQLIPTTVIAVRASLGSGAPAQILPAVWLTSLASAGVGLASAWCFSRLRRG